MTLHTSSPAACPQCGARLPAELLVEAVVELAMARPLSERTSARQAELRADVATMLALHPNVTANAVARSLGGRRSDVLRAVRELRGRPRAVPAPGNRVSEETRDDA
jgi:hypothetical protein